MSQEPPPFEVHKLPMRVNPTIFPSDNSSKMNAAQGRGVGRAATVGAPSGNTQRNSVEVTGQAAMEVQPVTAGVVVDRRAMGSALEAPVMFDGRRVDPILSGLSDFENQVRAIRARFMSLLLEIQDFCHDNSEFYEDVGIIIANMLQ